MKRNIIYALAAAAIFGADQAVKAFIVNNYSLYERFGSLGFLADFVYVRNTGAAFSLMSGKLGLLSIISVVFCVGIIAYWIIKKPSRPLLCTALLMLAAGALGNAVDRIFRGYVVDYISLSFIHFPVFNIADIGITVGAALIIIYVIFLDKEGRDGDKEKRDNLNDGNNS